MIEMLPWFMLCFWAGSAWGAAIAYFALKRRAERREAER